MEILVFIKDYGSQLSALSAVIVFVFGAYKYFLERKESHFWKEFEVYHKLVKELLEPSKTSEGMYVDRQAVILFELRNFRRYYPYSLRMLKGLQAKWVAVPNQFPRLLEEMDMTIRFLESKKPSKK